MAYDTFAAIDSYATGETITAEHYNTFATNLNQHMYTGYGQYGYGESTDDYAELAEVAVGDKIKAAEWNTLGERMLLLYEHQNGTSVSTDGFFTGGIEVGDRVRCFDGGTDVDNIDLQSNLLSLQTNSTSVASEFEATSTLSTTTTTTSWYHRMYEVADIVWDSADYARYFFNIGGRVTVTFAVTAIGTTTRDTDWINMVNGVTLEFGAVDTRSSFSSYGTSSLLDDGYYYGIASDSATLVTNMELSPTDGNYGTQNGSEDDDVYGMYAAAYAVDSGIAYIRQQMSALAQSVDGTNGDNGTSVRFTNAFYNPGGAVVHDQFQIIYGLIYPTDFTTSLVLPSVTVVTALEDTLE